LTRINPASWEASPRPDPAVFSKRLSDVMRRALAAQRLASHPKLGDVIGLRLCQPAPARLLSKTGVTFAGRGALGAQDP
jgi:hypothetical protein